MQITLIQPLIAKKLRLFDDYRGNHWLQHRFRGAFLCEIRVKWRKKLETTGNNMKTAWNQLARDDFETEITVFALCTKQYKYKGEIIGISTQIPEIAEFHVKSAFSAKIMRIYDNHTFSWKSRFPSASGSTAKKLQYDYILCFKM